MKILIHAIFWIVFSMFSWVVSMGRISEDWQYINNLTPHFFINLIWAAIIFYLFYFYFIRYFEKKQLTVYLVLSILSAFTLTFLLLPVHKLFNPQFTVLNYKYWLPPVAGTFIIAQCGSLVRGFEKWFTDIRLKSELENRNLRNELDLLRSQINPHFLFNALNNIDSFIHTSPNMASESLITLSGMLRYMIYETKSDRVPIDKELEYIRNYIQLQQLRHRQKNYIEISFPEPCTNMLVAPLILIPFIENAFKYANSHDKLPVIKILIQCADQVLHFSCSNQFKKMAASNEISGGFGLENARRRLTLLYPDKHELRIFEEDSVFNVQLKIRTD